MSFVPGWLFYLVSHYIMTGSFHILLFEGTPYVDKIHVRFKIANITHAPPVLVYQQTDFMLKHVVILHQLRDFVPEWHSRPSTMTGVNSHRGDSCRHVIFCWYHVNKCRATRGNRSELTPVQKLSLCHVNTRYILSFTLKGVSTAF